MSGRGLSTLGGAAEMVTATLPAPSMHTQNEPAIALYRKFGFVEEGRHRGFALRDGEYVDALAMARLHPRPPAWPGAR